MSRVKPDDGALEWLEKLRGPALKLRATKQQEEGVVDGG